MSSSERATVETDGECAGVFRASVSEQKEVSPIFVQWLDAVWQVTRQFPTAFEFSEALLVLLGRAVYSNRFRNFAFDCEAERRAHAAALPTQSPGGDAAAGGGLPAGAELGRGSSGQLVSSPQEQADDPETVGESVWEHIAAHRARYTNPFFLAAPASEPATEGGEGEGGRVLLRPSSAAASIRLWTAMYLPEDSGPDAPTANRPSEALEAWARRAAADAARGGVARAELERSRARVAELEAELTAARERAAAAEEAATGAEARRRLAEEVAAPEVGRMAASTSLAFSELGEEGEDGQEAG